MVIVAQGPDQALVLILTQTVALVQALGMTATLIQIPIQTLMAQAMSMTSSNPVIPRQTKPPSTTQDLSLLRKPSVRHARPASAGQALEVIQSQ
jgi:hypothetical protein